MSDLSAVFKAYDIRGLAPEEINASFARRFGQTVADIFHAKRVCVGRDARPTSPELERALIEGLTASGVHVTRIGLCSTPLMNATMGLAGGRFDFGIMVTASHNPAQYNGFKMTDKDVLPIGQGSGMERIRDRFLADTPFQKEKTRGLVSNDEGAVSAYLEKIFSLVDVSKIAPMKIAVDAGNGMAGVILLEFFRRLPQIEAVPLYWEPDGRFPNHEANPIKAETLVDLIATVKKEGCACGVAFDGDADRVGFVDETGAQIPGDLILTLLAEWLLRKRPKEKILYDLRSSWSAREAIVAAGGEAEMCRVGHAFIKRQMHETDAFFAGELSMHFYFRDLWNAESGDLAVLHFLALLSEIGKPLSAVWAPLRKYHVTPEINSEVKDADAVLVRIEEAYAAQASSVSRLDGVRMELGVGPDGVKSVDAWWFSVRKSNTEPLVRLIVEAVTEETMVKKRDELMAIIRGS